MALDNKNIHVKKGANMGKQNNHELSDDDYTDEELALIYGIPLGQISCEDDATDHEIESSMQ